MNKKKIIKDPVYGFISIPSELVQMVVDHPVFQRMRQIKQLGLADLIYPGATHSRFNHALGAMHLMTLALDTLSSKGVKITRKEYEGAVLAILMHDLGHGPFSHVLEKMIMPGIPHEKVSERIISELNKDFNGKLSTALEIFRGKHKKKFLNQLVSSQLDVDRLDYLARDSFFSGVDEGKIGADRIIRMMNVHQGMLVVEEKALYSLENFLNARRLMYWQVYLHKTTLSVENMLESIWTRARKLFPKGKLPVHSFSLYHFLERSPQEKRISKKDLQAFIALDDHDVWHAIKIWANVNDPILSRLCKGIVYRDLFKVILSEKRPAAKEVKRLESSIARSYDLNLKDSKYFVKTGSITNSAYIREKEHILVKRKDGSIVDIVEAADLPNIKAMSKEVKKSFLCYKKL